MMHSPPLQILTQQEPRWEMCKSASLYMATLMQSNTEAGSEGEFMGGQYQTATHFHFGDSLEPSSSIYNQGDTKTCIQECAIISFLLTDFSSEEVTTNYCLKQLPAPPPPSSKVYFFLSFIWLSTLTASVLSLLQVMHQFPIAIIGVSTSRRDFVRHNISQREGQRLASLNANKVWPYYFNIFMGPYNKHLFTVRASL